MNDLLASLLLGILEGLTEFLPISSTGHLLIAQHWLGARSDLFNIAIQSGAILAITLVYLVISVDRIFLGVHYLSDVVAGNLLGLCIALAGWLLLLRVTSSGSGW